MEHERLMLTEEWDKTFPKSEKVNHKKITFHNRYGIMLAADLYELKNADGKFPAIAVCGLSVQSRNSRLDCMHKLWQSVDF